LAISEVRDVPPGYKLTEIGVFPDAWDVEPISRLAETSSGNTPPRSLSDRYFFNGTIRWVKTQDLNNGELHETDEHVTEVAVKECGLTLYPAGSVVVAMYGGFTQIGRTGLLTMPSTVNQALTAIRPNAGRLVARYLIQVLNFRIEYWKTVASSSRKDPNITGTDVRNFLLPVPPLAEQSAVGDALSEIDTLLGSLNALIDKKRVTRQAAGQQLLAGKSRLPGFSGEWETKRFDDLFIRLNGKRNQIQSSEYRAHGRFPVVDQSHDRFVAFSDASHMLFRCPSGGVVVFGDHTRVVKFYEVDFLVGADGTQLLAVARPNVAKFAYYQLLSKEIPDTGYNRHFKFVKDLSFETPLPAEQSAITAVLSDMDAEIEALEKCRDKTRAIKQGMMQQLLTGRVRLVEPDKVES
jgi:type I restriction enzyme S subunit